MKKSRRFFLDIHEHGSLKSLLDSTGRVDVDERTAVFNAGSDTAVVTLENFILSAEDLSRAVWVGERTLVAQDRTLTFYPKARGLS